MYTDRKMYDHLKIESCLLLLEHFKKINDYWGGDSQHSAF